MIKLIKIKNKIKIRQEDLRNLGPHNNKEKVRAP
jgi:hypothetical protein